MTDAATTTPTTETISAPPSVSSKAAKAKSKPAKKRPAKSTHPLLVAASNKAPKKAKPSKKVKRPAKAKPAKAMKKSKPAPKKRPAKKGKAKAAKRPNQSAIDLDRLTTLLKGKGATVPQLMKKLKQPRINVARAIVRLGKLRKVHSKQKPHAGLAGARPFVYRVGS